jgi:glycosyltransferase involved in cell wall biosynthesis
VLIVDDNSPDEAGQIADRLSQENPERVSVLHREGKLGLGTAHRAGFNWGLERGFTCLVTMDADFSHPPQAIPEMVERFQRAGLVIGSRYVEGGKTAGWKILRKINSWAANFLSRLLMGFKARDTTGAFRAYRAECLERVPLERLKARGYAANLEILFFIQRTGAVIEEVPIKFVSREKGQSKISGREVREAIKIMLHYNRLKTMDISNIL